MTSYVRKPNTFDELELTTTTTTADVRAFFGQSYDTHRYWLTFVGMDAPGIFGLVEYRIDNQGKSSQELVTTNLGGYLRAERRGDGKTVGISYAHEALATDTLFQQA